MAISFRQSQGRVLRLNAERQLFPRWHGLLPDEFCPAVKDASGPLSVCPVPKSGQSSRNGLIGARDVPLESHALRA